MSWESAQTCRREDPTKEEILAAWEAAAAKLAEAKEAEMQLRNQVVEVFYPNHKDEGTENVPLENGFKLKAVFKLNRILAGKDEVDAALTKMEKTGVEGKFIADRIVTWKPALDKKEYDKCPEKLRKFIDEVLTVKPATPSLELVAPKAKR